MLVTIHKDITRPEGNYLFHGRDFTAARAGASGPRRRRARPARGAAPRGRTISNKEMMTGANVNQSNSRMYFVLQPIYYDNYV